MSSNQSHSAIIFGSISIDRIENIHGSFNKVLGGSAAYALLANPKKTCEQQTNPITTTLATTITNKNLLHQHTSIQNKNK